MGKGKVTQLIIKCEEIWFSCYWYAFPENPVHFIEKSIYANNPPHPILVLTSLSPSFLFTFLIKKYFFRRTLDLPNYVEKKKKKSFFPTPFHLKPHHLTI